MRCLWICCAFAAALMLPSLAAAVDLYTEDFDVDHSANWLLSANEGFGTSPADGLNDPDASADYFFDYSTVGIPAAPNSTGGSTRGMKIQANLVNGIFGGASASPVDQGFTGDYKVTFDLWGNYVGDPVNGLATGGLGQTNMSTYGILTDGATGVVPGVSDGVWFAGMVDGFSSADFRAYSIERTISYQLPPDMTVLDGMGQPVDSHANYLAGSRDSAAALYMSNFGGVAAPAAQLALYPQQLGTTPLGSLGMEWHNVEISKTGNLVSWKIDGVELITLDVTNFTTQPDGTNIFFGHSDINAGSSAEPDRFALQFSLFDNIKVSTIDTTPVINADFNDDMTVDAADYVIWRKNDGLATGATQGMGDSDADGDVDNVDYTNWAATFGSTVPGSGSVVGAAVPEPATVLLVALGISAAAFRRRRK